MTVKRRPMQIIMTLKRRDISVALINIDMVQFRPIPLLISSDIIVNFVRYCRNGDNLPGARGSPAQHHVDSSQRGADRHHSWTQTGSSWFLFFWPQTDSSFSFLFLASDRLVHSKCYKFVQIGCFWYHQSPIGSIGKKLRLGDTCGWALCHQAYPQINHFNLELFGWD